MRTGRTEPIRHKNSASPSPGEQDRHGDATWSTSQTFGGEGAGWEWSNCGRAGLSDGAVAVNSAGAWLHNVADEAYVVASACFEAFAAGRELRIDRMWWADVKAGTIVAGSVLVDIAMAPAFL